MTVANVDAFIADLKDSVKEAKIAPSGKGLMVSVYGRFLIFVPIVTIMMWHLYRSGKFQSGGTVHGRRACSGVFGCTVQGIGDSVRALGSYLKLF